VKTQNKDKPQETRQKFDDVETNPIALPEDYTKQIMEQLNTDAASHFMTFYQLKKQHWIVRGPDWKLVSAALDAYAKTNLELAEELAERITLMGGIPVSNPSDLKICLMYNLRGTTNTILEPCWKMT
jgi:starvation-inducible DNA-binding protein